MNLTGVRRFAAGESVALLVAQDSGSALQLSGDTALGASTELTVTWMGP